MTEYHYFTPHVTVTTEDGKVIRCHIDWGDSYTESYRGGVEDTWGNPASMIAGTWLDDMVDMGLLPSGDFQLYTEEQVKTALRFLTTLALS